MADRTLQEQFAVRTLKSRKALRPLVTPVFPQAVVVSQYTHPAGVRVGFNKRRNLDRKLLQVLPQPVEDVATWVVIADQTQRRQNTTSRVLVRVPARVFTEVGSPIISSDRSLQQDFKTNRLPLGKRLLTPKALAVFPATPAVQTDYQPPPAILFRGKIERNLLRVPTLNSVAAAPAAPVQPVLKAPAVCERRVATDRWLITPIPLYRSAAPGADAWKQVKRYKVSFNRKLLTAKLGFYKTLPVFIGPNISNMNFVQNVAISPQDLSVYFRGGQPTLTYSMIGSLPTGLSLSGAGILSGTPTVLGTTAGLQVQATNGAQNAQSNAFSITINPAGTVIGKWFKLLWRLQVTQALLDAGYYTIYTGSSAGAGNTAIDSDEVSTKDCFMVQSVSGSVEVLGQLREGGSFSSPLALQDLNDTSAGLVAATVAGKMYGFVGNYHKLRVRQVGATAVTEVLLRGWSRTFHG